MGTVGVVSVILVAQLAGGTSSLASEPHEGCSTVVPVELDEKSHVLVRFDIQGEEVQLFLDTGNATAGVDVNPTVLKRLAVSFSGSSRKVVDWRGNLVEERVYSIPEVRLGDLVLTNVPGHEYRVSDVADGSFSFAAFPECNVLIDLPRGKFGLVPRGSHSSFAATEGWSRFPFQISSDGGVELTSTLEGLPGTFVLGLDNAAISIGDAGRHYNLVRSRSSLGRYLLENDQLSAADEPAALGLFATTRLLVAGQPLGALEFLVVDYPFPRIDGLLGSAFFLDYSVFVDFSRRLLYVNRRGTRD